MSLLIWMSAVAALVMCDWSFSLQMACSYGERGSLTVYCVNASAVFFKLSPYRFDHLDETLKCINCTLPLLESGTFDISGNQIRTLDIRNSSINKISSKAFIGLIFMEKLLLSDNHISTIYREAFAGIRKVKYIELENAVSRLDAFVFQELHSLEVLSLKRNSLTALDQNTFVGLDNLKILDLSFNKLRTVNDCFEPLASLKVLKLQDNQLGKITGTEFSKLLSLIQLNLESNGLTNFTVTIDANNELRILNLARNRLTSEGMGTGTFENLNNLEDLDLSKNLFTKVPPRFFQGLLHLRNLNLYSNQIKAFSTGTFTGLPHLLRLNLSSNYLETANVSGRLLLYSLHTLDLSNNRIKNFDYISFIATMPRITHINLLNNYLPCETAAEIETLFDDDHIRFYMSNNEAVESCDTVPKSPKEIIQKLTTEKYKVPVSLISGSVWVVLICIIIILIGFLFYIQFFILYKVPLRTINVRLLRNASASS